MRVKAEALALLYAFTSMASFSIPPLAPPDAVFAVSTAYNNCKLPEKVSLGVGAYRGEDGEPLVLQSVVEAKKRFSKVSDRWGLPNIVASLLNNCSTCVLHENALSDEL